jgi:mono/diheme cytochrome c family protein
LVKEFAALLVFLAVSVALLVAVPVRPASGTSSKAAAASSAEGSARLLVPPEGVAPAAMEKGRRIFLRDCAHCHGAKGDGMSSNRDTLHPIPFDLTSFELTRSFIRRVVRDGLPGSDMPGWSLGTVDEVVAVSNYTASLGRRDALSAQERYAPPDALREAGRRVYTMHCATCHGEQGMGDGPDAGKHLPRPASFADMRPSYAVASQVIQNGVRGTDMPSWPLLTSPEIQAVTFYVRTLYTNTRMDSGARP